MFLHSDIKSWLMAWKLISFLLFLLVLRSGQRILCNLCPFAFSLFFLFCFVCLLLQSSCWRLKQQFSGLCFQFRILQQHLLWGTAECSGYVGFFTLKCRFLISTNSSWTFETNKFWKIHALELFSLSLSHCVGVGVRVCGCDIST